jgi:hypothetical protein
VRRAASRWGHVVLVVVSRAVVQGGLRAGSCEVDCGYAYTYYGHTYYAPSRVRACARAARSQARAERGQRHRLHTPLGARLGQW